VELGLAFRVEVWPLRWREGERSHGRFWMGREFDASVASVWRVRVPVATDRDHSG
jgi:hypothetical protein